MVLVSFERVLLNSELVGGAEICCSVCGAERFDLLTMACNLAVHGPHYVAEGSGANLIKEPPHQTLICGVPPLHLARHASADICHPKDIKPLSSQAHGCSSHDKTSMHWHKAHIQDASTQSRLVEDYERSHTPVGGVIKLNPIANLNSSETNRPRAQSKLNLHVQFADVVEEHKQDEREPNGSRLAADDSASPSSSIGQVSLDSSCDNPTEEMEVQSSRRSPLDHMGSLEESLPIKRGLSRFFSGKSRSFTSLSDVSSIRDLAKAENSHAKKRKWHGSVNVNLSGDPPLSNPVVALCSKKPFSSARSTVSFAIEDCSEASQAFSNGAHKIFNPARSFSISVLKSNNF